MGLHWLDSMQVWHEFFGFKTTGPQKVRKWIMNCCLRINLILYVYILYSYCSTEYLNFFPVIWNGHKFEKLFAAGDENEILCTMDAEYPSKTKPEKWMFQSDQMDPNLDQDFGHHGVSKVIVVYHDGWVALTQKLFLLLGWYVKPQKNFGRNFLFQNLNESFLIVIRIFPFVEGWGVRIHRIWVACNFK